MVFAYKTVAASVHTLCNSPYILMTNHSSLRSTGHLGHKKVCSSFWIELSHSYFEQLEQKWQSVNSTRLQGWMSFLFNIHGSQNIITLWVHSTVYTYWASIQIRCSVYSWQINDYFGQNHWAVKDWIPLVTVKDQSSHLVYLNICTK